MPPNPFYDFLSGLGSFVLKGSIVIVLWHHLRCHEPRCWRPARHRMGGYCRRHRKET